MTPLATGIALSLLLWVHRIDNTRQSPWLAVMVAALAAITLFPRGREDRPLKPNLLPALVAASLIIAHYFRSKTDLSPWIQLCLLFQILMIFLTRFRRDTLRIVPLLIFLISEMVKLFVLLRNPEPPIDTFSTIQEGIDLWFKGMNPYLAETLGEQPGQNYGYVVRLVYWPVNLLLVLPAKLFLNDVRYAYWLADAFFALALGWIAGRRSGKTDFWLVALWACLPATPYLLLYAWTDPLALAVFTAAVMSLEFSKKPMIRGFSASLALLIKLYVALPLAIFFVVRHRPLLRESRFWMGAALPLGFTLSFLWPNPAVVIARWFEVLQHPMRFDSLSIRASGAYLGDWWSPWIPAADHLFWTVASIAMVAGTAALSLRSRSSARILEIQAAGLALLFCCSKQAFANYYYFVAGLMFLAHAVSSSDSTSSDDNPAFLSR